MNNYWTYGQIFSVLRRFFLSRGGDILSDDEAIWSYLMLAIQDMYNSDSSIFRHVVEDIEGTVNGEYTIFKTQMPIHKIQKCFKYNSLGEVSTEENNRLIPRFIIKDKSECTFSGNEITTLNEIKKIKVLYIKDFQPLNITDKGKICEIPFRYIPALIKLAFDWGSPINLMSGESSTVDFYSHGMNRLDKINKDDGLSDYMEINSAY